MTDGLILVIAGAAMVGTAKGVGLAALGGFMLGVGLMRLRWEMWKR